MAGPGFVQTPRLTLRLVQESDAPALREIWLDFAQSPFAVYDCPHPTSPQAVAASIARWAQANRQPQPVHRFWAVCLQNRLIGYFSCHQRENAACEIGYCFHSAFHGCGYARESLCALLAFLPTQGFVRATAGTALNNRPSVALLSSLGFTQTATERVSFYQDSAGNPIVFTGGVFEKPLP